MSESQNGHTLLSFAETATLLHVSRPTLYKIIKRGDLTPDKRAKRGTQYRSYFLKSKVIAFATNYNPQIITED